MHPFWKRALRVTPVHNGAAPDIIYWYLASPIIRLLVKLITLFPVALHYTRPSPDEEGRRAGGESSNDGSPYLMANVSHHPANTGKLGIVPRPPYFLLSIISRYQKSHADFTAQYLDISKILFLVSYDVLL